MPTSMANMPFNVIVLSSDDEDAILEKISNERHHPSSTGGLAVKQELSQGSQDQEMGSVLLSAANNAPVQNRLKQVELGHSDGVDDTKHAAFASLSDGNGSSVHPTRNATDQIGSKHAFQGNCQMSDPESSHSSQLVQQILNKMDATGSKQGLQLNYQKLPKIGKEISPLCSSTQNCSGIRPKKNGFYQFWKAGEYDVQAAPKRAIPGGMHHVRVHPKFLHSNATSHKWAFGAIAELLDNAVDEIQNGASFVIVDNIPNPHDNSPALLFRDNGGGMDPDCIRQCMSFGYSLKNTNTTIGQYGNGFKTSTMRLGADVIVFSRSARGRSPTESIGLLSYTFLRKTGQDDTVVPMIDFEIPLDFGKPKMLMRSTEDDWLKNLTTILQWSPYKTEGELMEQFEDLGPHGTKIVIFNLWLNDDGISELDFDSDEKDIRLRDGDKPDMLMQSQKALLQSSISYRLRYSLRVYASILYLKKPPNFRIILRGKPIEHHCIANDLKFSKVITYKPQLGIGAKEVIVETTIGFAEEAPLINVHGFNVYHKNRLITPFWKIWPNNTNSRGRGVVGVLEANFIEPAHDKQDFERTAVLLRLESRLKQMTADYWRQHCELIGYQATNKSTAENHQNSSPPPSLVENPPSLARVVPGGSLPQNSVSCSMPVPKFSRNHGQIAQSVMVVPSCHDSHTLADTRKGSHGNLDTPHTRETMPGQPFTRSISIPVEKNPNSTVLSTIVSSGYPAQPNELGKDSVLTHSEESLIPDPGLESVVADKEQTPAAFDQALDNADFSLQDTAKRKVPEALPCDSEDPKRHRNCEEAILPGTLQEQIAEICIQQRASKSGEKRNSQEAVVSFPSKFVEKLSEQNIQVFMRCEQYRHNEMQLHQMITRLENELRDALRKLTQLRSNVEAQKKQRAESLRIT